MTQRILTTTALVGAALVLSVPAAWGSEPYRDHGDATEAKLAVQPAPLAIVRDHGDATEAKLAAKLALQSSPVIVRDHGDATDAKLALQSSPEIFPAEKTSRAAGRDIDWSQLGIGVGVGMLFVLGVILAVRLTRSRTLAH